MNDKWININYEADNLQPYKEPDLFKALAEDRIGKWLVKNQVRRLCVGGDMVILFFGSFYGKMIISPPTHNPRTKY